MNKTGKDLNCHPVETFKINDQPAWAVKLDRIYFTPTEWIDGDFLAIYYNDTDTDCLRIGSKSTYGRWLRAEQTIHPRDLFNKEAGQFFKKANYNHILYSCIGRHMHIFRLVESGQLSLDQAVLQYTLSRFGADENGSHSDYMFDVDADDDDSW